MIKGKTTLAFLWHMHQPYYRNMITKECIQPWARLHGIHSYYDMIQLYSEFPEVCADINFVPSLLKQLREYAEEGLSDKFLDISRIDAKELTPENKMFILRNFFMANPERMIFPYPRYAKLYNQRGMDTSKIDFEDAIRFFSWKDFLDIQVYYNLVWFGFKAREEFPIINEMLSKTSSTGLFTEEDKKIVLDIQFEVIKKLLAKLKDLPKNIELTSTPFFHPILPLVTDTDIAKRCMPDATLPPRFQAPDVARFQIQHGSTYFEQTIGKKCRGMWPSEGSVAPEIIPFFAEAGIEWIATDEGILERSGVKGDRNEWLYQPYTAEYQEKSITMVFRDRDLSDRVGFTYARMPSADAVRDFIDRIEQVCARAKGEHPLITILLDGENAWEFYENSGREFLTGLLTQLRDKKIRTATISGFLADHPPKHKITKLFSGSWIASNFQIWIGKPQKNTAWSYIKMTMDEVGKKLTHALSNVNRSHKELLAIETFMAACGSDWFWWFDDDFSSEFKSDFDKIFRMHLKNTFVALEKEIPVFLYEPIHQYPENSGHSKGPLTPQAFIYPKIDGLNTAFFEWSNAVKINVGKNRGPMGQTEELLENIYFGFNAEQLFLRLDSLNKEVTFTLSDDEELVIYIHNSANFKIKCFFDGKKYQAHFVENAEDGYKTIGNEKIEFAIKNVFEMGLKFADLGIKTGDNITIVITVLRKGAEVRHYSHIHFIVPDENYERQMWSV